MSGRRSSYIASTVPSYSQPCWRFSWREWSYRHPRQISTCSSLRFDGSLRSEALATMSASWCWTWRSWHHYACQHSSLARYQDSSLGFFLGSFCTHWWLSQSRYACSHQELMGAWRSRALLWHCHSCVKRYRLSLCGSIGDTYRLMSAAHSCTQLRTTERSPDHLWLSFASGLTLNPYAIVPWWIFHPVCAPSEHSLRT